ncbi:MAG: serine protease [Polyangiales bacterium]
MSIDWDTDNVARRRLREALAKNDPKARAADTVCEDIGVDPSRVDFNGAAENIWFSVIEEAKKSRCLADLAALAAERWPKDESLQKLSAGIAPTRAQPHAHTTSPQALALGAGVVAEVMAERVRDPLEKVLSELQIADAAQWVANYQAMMGRVALVHTGAKGSGTGFLIGPDLVLTNWHVVECVANGSVSPADVTVRFDYWRPPGGLADQFTDVKLAPQWLIDHSPWSAADIDVNTTALPRPDELDFALLRLARPIGSETRDGAPRGWITLPKETRVSPGQSVLILQHPNGHPLRLAFDGVLSMNANNTRVRYRTNTLPGSSGSPCFDQNWTLLALHHAGDPRLASTYNEGVPAAAIRALLEQHDKVTIRSAV